MPWVIVALAVVVGGFAWMAAQGRFGGMPPLVDDRPGMDLPDGDITADSLREVRLAVVSRGYSMSQVDALLERLALQLDGIHHDPMDEYDIWRAIEGDAAQPAVGTPVALTTASEPAQPVSDIASREIAEPAAAEPVVQPEVVLEPELAAEPDLVLALEPEPEFEPEPQPESAAEPWPILEAEPEFESFLKSEPGAEPEREPEPAGELWSVLESEPAAEPEPDLLLALQPEPDVESFLESEPAVEPWSVLESEPGAEPVTEPAVEPASVLEPEPAVEPAASDSEQGLRPRRTGRARQHRSG